MCLLFYFIFIFIFGFGDAVYELRLLSCGRKFGVLDYHFGGRCADRQPAVALPMCDSQCPPSYYLFAIVQLFISSNQLAPEQQHLCSCADRPPDCWKTPHPLVHCLLKNMFHPPGPRLLLPIQRHCYCSIGQSLWPTGEIRLCPADVPNQWVSTLRRVTPAVLSTAEEHSRKMISLQEKASSALRGARLSRGLSCSKSRWVHTSGSVVCLCRLLCEGARVVL